MMESKLKELENKCSCKEKRPIKAHCGKCHMYICGDCHMFKHIDHDSEIVDLASKCTRFLVDYQRLSRTAGLLEGRRQIHIHDVSIEKVADELKGKLRGARDQLQSDLTRVTDSSLRYLASSSLIRDLAIDHSSLSTQPEPDPTPLLTLKRDLDAAVAELVLRISENKLESADKLLNPKQLLEFEQALQKLANDGGPHSAFREQLARLKEAKIAYSYNPALMLGLIHVESELQRSNRLLQFDRARNLLYAFNTERQKLLRTNLNPSFMLPFRFVTIEVAGSLYLTGGDNDHGHFLDSLYLCDDFRGSFLQLASMHRARSGHALALSGVSSFAAIGGEGKEGVLAACEVYEASENVWRHGPALNEPRCALSACPLGKFVYAIGGWNKCALTTIERVDFSGKKRWERLKITKKPHLRPRQLFGAVGIRDNEILIFGGYRDADEVVPDSAILNVKALELSKTPPLPCPNAFIASELRRTDSTVFAFGYENGGVYAFDIEKKDWTYTPHDKLPT